MIVSIVTSNKPKVLIGLNQKVSGRVIRVNAANTQIKIPPVYRSILT